MLLKTNKLCSAQLLAGFVLTLSLIRLQEFLNIFCGIMQIFGDVMIMQMYSIKNNYEICFFYVEIFSACGGLQGFIMGYLNFCLVNIFGKTLQ